MKLTFFKKGSAVIALAALLLIPVSGAHAETDVSEEALSIMTVSATTSGYGGDCTIPVTPPSGGFSLSVSPIQRNWWEWWVSPKVWLGINGGDAYKMTISNHSDFSNASTYAYSTGVSWKVHRPEREGWKTVYIKFQSSCGKESPTVSRSYYYWGW